MGSAKTGRRERFSLGFLEPRLLLGGGMAHEVVLPEGYATDAIRQSVPISNPGALPADYRLVARYERDFAEQVLATGTLAPDTRGTIRISDPDNPGATTVRRHEPYALVLESTQPLVASLEHADFGTLVSMPFTDARSSVWSFAEVRRLPDDARDFVLVYNPSSGVASVTLSFFDGVGEVLSIIQAVGPMKRSGWAIEDVAGLPSGVYGVRITASASIVASLSSYGLSVQKSYGLIGSPGGGALSGVTPITDVSLRTADSDAVGAPLDPSRDSIISILNTSGVTANITLSFIAADDSQAPETRSISVSHATRAVVSLQDLSLPDDFEFALAYTADAPVTIALSSQEGFAGGGTGIAQAAASDWDFAGGFMNAARAGQGLIESLAIYNPQATSLEVNIDLLGSDGQVFSLSLLLDSRRSGSVPIHLIAAFVARSTSQTYAIHLTASQPLVAAYRRWDVALGGGFVTLGSPGSNAISLNGMTP